MPRCRQQWQFEHEVGTGDSKISAADLSKHVARNFNPLNASLPCIEASVTAELKCAPQ